MGEAAVTFEVSARQSYEAGLSHLADGRLEEARVEFVLAADLCPELPGCLVALSGVYLRLMRYEEALEAATRLGDEARGEYMLWVYRGLALRRLRRVAEAVEAFSRAIEMRPGCVVARMEMGAALLCLGRGEESLGQHRLAVECAPGCDEARFRYALACELAGDIRAALCSYKVAVTLNPYHARAYYYGGLAAERLGLWSEALSLYMNALEVAPRFGEVLARLPVVGESGGSYLTLGQSFWLSTRLSVPPFVNVVPA
jgi:tetratricopeptide (TPR) repeat protein